MNMLKVREVMLKFSSAVATGTVVFYAGSFVYTAGLIACFLL